MDRRVEALAEHIVQAGRDLPRVDAPPRLPLALVTRNLLLVLVPASGPVTIRQLRHFPVPVDVLLDAPTASLSVAARSVAITGFTRQYTGTPSAYYVCRKADEWTWFTLSDDPTADDFARPT